ncbi:MAG: NRDE family protein [Pseudomonadota bacterium]|nr:NRDE family protein [Pseudomonadota bacterium]
MCLILLAWRRHPDYPLVVAANRDEFYERPTLAADFWEDQPGILGGRDLKEKGTWLGITRKGRFAALTNYRDPLRNKEDAPSRGWLVRDFLAGREGAAEYLGNLKEEADRYNGFSLILGDAEELHYYSNRGGAPVVLPPGIYGLSNHLLDSPWPKVIKAREGLRRVTSRAGRLHPEDLFALLADRSRPADEELPDTGVGREWERILASIFIASPIYGTRSSTVILKDRRNRIRFEERQYAGGDGFWMSTVFVLEN